MEAYLLKLELQSAGYSDACEKAVPVYIRVNGAKLVDTNYTRGMNVAILNGQTGKLKDIKAFDTYQSQEETASMLKFLKDNATTSDIIAIVAQDEATNSLTSEAKEYLKSLGSNEISNVGYRCPWTFVAIKKGKVLLDKTGPTEKTITESCELINFGPVNSLQDKLTQERAKRVEVEIEKEFLRKKVEALESELAELKKKVEV